MHSAHFVIQRCQHPPSPTYPVWTLGVAVGPAEIAAPEDRQLVRRHPLQQLRLPARGAEQTHLGACHLVQQRLDQRPGDGEDGGRCPVPKAGYVR